MHIRSINDQSQLCLGPQSVHLHMQEHDSHEMQSQYLYTMRDFKHIIDRIEQGILNLTL